MSKDDHLEVYKQAFREWQAHGAIIFTSGNGTAAVASTLERIPTLAFGIDEAHANVLQYSKEKAMARYIARNESVAKISETGDGKYR